MHTEEDSTHDDAALPDQPFRFNEIRRVGRLIRVYEYEIERWVECAE